MDELINENISKLTSSENNNSTPSVKIQVSTHIEINARNTLEDRYVCENDLNSAFDLDLPHKYRYYAVFDGHINSYAAEYCKKNLHIHLIENDKFLNGEISQALKEAFIEADEGLCTELSRISNKSGTTALVCLIEDDRRIYFAWAGDSTSILIKNGQPILLTQPHTPNYEKERNRIKKMGGQSIYTNIWRVMGVLAVSRSIGDPDYKPFLTAEPEIIELELNGSEDFLVLSSDGLLDSLSPEDVSTIVYEFLALNADEPQNEIVDQISKLLIERSINEGSSDNITAIVIFLKDLAKISPSLKTSKQNGHHKTTNEEELVEQNDIQNGNKENGNLNNIGLNVNATPFQPNNLFNNISISSIESIRVLQEKALNDCLQENINITSNEDNIHDDNLCELNNEMDDDNIDEQPHSILANINDDELQRELDEERVIKVEKESEENKLNEDEEDNNCDDDEMEELNKNDLKTIEETVNCEYSVIPIEVESTASPVDLISESTTTEELVENKHDQNENENLSNSPFEQIVEDQKLIENNEKSGSLTKLDNGLINMLGKDLNNELIKDDTLIENAENFNKENLEDFNKENQEDFNKENQEDFNKENQENIQPTQDEIENSFEFIEMNLNHTQQMTDQNTTQYVSPDNSKLQDDTSFYENANPLFDNSALNKDLFQYREQTDVLDDEQEHSHPFENDSEESIKYLDKTASNNEILIDQVFDNRGAIENNEIDDLANLMHKTNINDNQGQNVDNQTFNLLENDENNELYKDSVPELAKTESLQIEKPIPTLLDTTLEFNDNPPILISPTNQQQFIEDKRQIFNENHFEDENEQDSSSNDLQANFELIKDEDNKFNNVEQNNQANETNNKQIDMDLTYLMRTEEINICPDHYNMINENQSVINEEVPKDGNLSHGNSKEVEEQDLNSKNLDVSSTEYIVANQDQSFIHEKDQDDHKLIKEQFEESKVHLVTINPTQINSENNDLNKDNESSELNNELVNNEHEEIKLDDIIEPEKNNVKENELSEFNKIEIFKETAKELNEEYTSSLVKTVVNGITAVPSATSAMKKVNTSLTTKKSLNTINKSSANKTKNTKSDNESTIKKDSKLNLKSSSSLNKALTKKPVAITTATTNKTSTITRKPLSTSTKTSVTSTTSSSKLVTNKPLATKTKAPITSKSTTSLIAPKTTTSKLPSTVKSTITSRLNTASSKPTTKSTTNSTITNKSSSSLTSKLALSKATNNKPASRLTTSKYSNVTSRVSSSLPNTTKSTSSSANSKPASSLNTAKVNSKTTTSSGLTKKLAPTNTLKTNKPSTITNKLTSNVASKVSSTRQTLKLSANKTTPTTTSSPTTNNKKTTAVPRKPLNKTQLDSNSLSVGQKSAKMDNQTTENGSEINSNSIKSNSLVNGTLTNGDQINTTPTTTNSITSSKSRDKLANSLKAELEAAMELNNLPK